MNDIPADDAGPRLHCPRCAGVLEKSGDRLGCAGCDAWYPIVCDIPDLRTGADPYLSRDDDRRAAERLAGGGGDFVSRLASYYENNAKVGAAQARRFMDGTVAASSRAASTLASWRAHETRTDAPAALSLLDVGCGTAPLAVSAALAGLHAVAIDVGLRWLVLARVRAVEAGLTLPVICANAEALPFAPGVFDRVGGESIVELTDDPAAAVAEWARVLANDGRLWLTTPNRRSVGPDPHTGRLAGGWYGAAATAAWSEKNGMVPPRRWLFDSRSISSLLADAGFVDIRLTVPAVVEDQRSHLSVPLALAVRGYELVRRFRPGRAVLLHIGPTLVVTATYPG